MIKKILQLFRFRGFISIVYYIAFLALLWYLIIPRTGIFYRTNLYDPIGHRLNTEDITLVRGESFKLYVMRLNQRVTYSSTDIKVADVNILGKVFAFRPGTTIIKVKYKDNVLKCRVRVIDISKKKVTLKKGRSTRLTVKGAWFGARWSSSNSSIVSVSRFGKVTAKRKGSAKIYAKIRGKVVTCNVRVE